MSRAPRRLLAGLLVLGTVLIAAYITLGPRYSLPLVGGDDVSGEWMMEGYNGARTRAVASDLALPLHESIEIVLGEAVADGSPVAVARGIGLIEAERTLRAVDLRSGRERWSFPARGTYLSPATDGESVYLKAESANRGQVFALDLETGAQRWVFTPKRVSSAEQGFVGGHVTSPALSGDAVIVASGKELYALNKRTGEPMWELSMTEWVTAAPAVRNGRIFLADSKFVYAVDERTGELAWKKPAAFSLYFAPIVADDTVYIRDGKKIVALASADGKKRWENPVGGESLIPGAVSDGRLLVVTTGALLALDIRTGQEVWRYSQPNYVSLPAVAGTKAFLLAGATGQTALTALDVESGKASWSQRIPELAPAAPVVVGKTVYVGTIDGRLLGYSSSS
jgi:outer membrane protein assembly factor BamB